MFTSVDNYCERLDPSFWAEPLNAITNLSFILSALIVVIVLRGKQDIATLMLTSILFAIGIGSFLFHTFAQQWASLADVIPILLFILTFVFFATQRFLRQSVVVSGISVVGFFPYAIGSAWVVSKAFGPLNGSTLYISVALLICIYAAILRRKSPQTARGLAIGAGILAISITFRSLDQVFCASLPIGTHFLWHLLNGVMLGWMILVMAKHRAN